MAGDDHDKESQEKEVASDDDGGFENYSPTTIDPGWWMFGSTCIFCVALLGFLVYLLWLTQHNRKRVEAERNATLARMSDEEEAIAKADKATVGTASTEDLDADSILTEVEDDDDDFVINDDEPIYDAFCSCGADEITMPSVALTVRRGRQTRGGAVLLNGLFGRNQEKQGFVRHNKRTGVVLVETTTKDTKPKLPMEIKVDSKASDYRQMEDKQKQSQITDEKDASDYHQLGGITSTGIGTDKEASTEKQSSSTSKATKQVRRAIKSFWRKIRRVAIYDNETKRIFKLAIPYTLTGLASCVSYILTVAVIGNLLGTEALSAYLTVSFAASLSTTWLTGLLSSLTTLCSQAIGVGNGNLAGQYVQIAVVISQILYLPQLFFWMYFIKDLIIWFGFNDQTAEIGYRYAIVLFPHTFMGYISDGLDNLLVVCGREQLSAMTSILHSIIQLAAILSVALVSQPSLQTIGIIQLVVDIFIFVILLLYIGWKDLLREYRSGMIGSFALSNTEAVKQLLHTAVPLSISEMVSEGEYQLLYVFASLLGPAEVVAWGLFNTLWWDLQLVTSALGGAAEVRCANLLGADKPMRAKHSAQKALLVGTIQGLIVVAFLAIWGGHLSRWMTSDVTVQTMLTELIPMLCIGIFFDIYGCISFALVGAQGCYGLATAVYLTGSWLVTIPLAILFSVVINFNLEGLAASVVIGSTLSGLTNTFLLLDSDWYYFADSVREGNRAEVG